MRGFVLHVGVWPVCEQTPHFRRNSGELQKLQMLLLSRQILSGNKESDRSGAGNPGIVNSGLCFCAKGFGGSTKLAL